MNPATKGLATSEGQMTVVAVIGAIVAALAPLDVAVQVTAIICAAVVAVAYIVTRAHLKITAVTTNLVKAPSARKANT
jgi:ABC-type uncharacterized transport system permease subunit